MNCKESITVSRQAVDWLKKHYPDLCIKAGLCEMVCGRLYTKTLSYQTPLPAHEIVTMYDESPTCDADMIEFAHTIESAACADRDARIAELEKEKQYVKEMTKEMTKDRHHWMTVAAERALLLDKNRKVNKPLSDYEFDEIG